MLDLRIQNVTLQEQLLLYEKDWQAMVKEFSLAKFQTSLKATAVGWKVGDLKTFSTCTVRLLQQMPQVHIGPVNEVRLIGSFVFDEPIYKQARVLKLMQRRPGSHDRLGLDHIDFTVDDISAAKTALLSKGLAVEEESNDVHSWLSVRFGKDKQHEAKFVDHTVLDACIAELREARDNL